MTESDRALRELFVAAIHEGALTREYLARAEAAGHSLANAMNVLFDETRASAADRRERWLEDEYIDWWDEPVVGLVQHLEGDTERAQAVLDATRGFRGCSARERWAAFRAALDVRQAIALGASSLEVLAVLRAPTLAPEDRHWLACNAILRVTNDELPLLATSEDPEARALVRRVCARRDPLEVLVSIQAHADARAILEAMACAFDVVADGEADPEIALATLHARLLAERARSVRDAMTRVARVRDVRAWLPAMRAEGLGASAVALSLIERAPPWPMHEIARVLGEGGYADDEVLRALLENGLGSRRALLLLGEHGWSVDRMSASLLGRGMLLPEVRDLLLGLGLTRAAVADVLFRHADAALVALVIDGA